VRRFGAGVIAAWPSLPPEAQQMIFEAAKTVWDREFHVSKLPDKLSAIIRRGHA
jgi:hypothetical protein